MNWKINIVQLFLVTHKHLSRFLVVRQVAVRSLSRLASSRPSFASKAMDFLADMFNDEIEQVRLDAINCLLPLVCHDTLQEHQMEVILNVLDVSFHLYCRLH